MSSGRGRQVRDTALIVVALSTLIGCSLTPANKEHISGHAIQERRVDELVEKAAEYGKRGELTEAVALLDEALRINPQHAIAFTVRATAFRKLGDFQRAVEDATKAVEIDPRLAEAYCQRAFAYQQSELEHRVERALADANKAIALDPTAALSFIVRGNVESELEEYSEAIADFTKAIELNPRSYTAYGNRAHCYSALGNTAMARADINKALALNPGNADEPALQELRKTLEKQP